MIRVGFTPAVFFQSAPLRHRDMEVLIIHGCDLARTPARLSQGLPAFVPAKFTLTEFKRLCVAAEGRANRLPECV